jgi:hypothetical protein
LGKIDTHSHNGIGSALEWGWGIFTRVGYVDTRLNWSEVVNFNKGIC